MTIFRYIDKYGNLTFKEKPLNDIDKLIFALLSYVKYDGAISTNSFDRRTIKDIADKFFEDKTRTDIKTNITAIRTAIKVLDKIKDKERFKNLKMFNDVYMGDDNKQFSAVCIEINPKLIYVSFEGTDELMSGWEEDGALSYKFPIPSQSHAIRYLNFHFTLRDCKIIVGGHSKGGNLALVSSMYANFIVKNKIIEVWNFDGPGLRNKQFFTNRFNEITRKYHFVIPNTSVVGLLLRNNGNHVVVKSNALPFFSHNAATWQVGEDTFVTTELSAFSKIVDEGVTKWLQKYSAEEREEYFKCFFNVFDKNNIESLLDIMKNYKLVVSIIKELGNTSDKFKEMSRDLASLVRHVNREYLKSKFSIRNLLKRD